ncbi:winged helix-turn-helix domain-containing protein [Enterobacteriaceae bacterium H18W14]|uniref:winged helix-turn-helix domain-containing protein n=1 Tax=Dryocola boscaweniae TaxID=2925397 RepID=UPI0022F03656|nr:winged helix-turn-helix domain-containing protein [Dryocola boscaweniae]MCT4714319.1 winged helix-turn-helix domain-containing protein [Dryocola boscaweniae]
MALPYLTLRAARNLHLAAQGLLTKPRRRARASDISKTISQMSLLQIDTINIVARSPYLVLFSRLGQYSPGWLDEALASGELIEYWAHEACFLPKDDFALVRHRMLQPENMGWKYKPEWMVEHAKEIELLLNHIAENGPVRSADFEHPRKGAGGWWEWKPHKKHLEGLFTSGLVMVIERRNFQRVYDLTTRVMPDWNDELHLIHQQDAERQMLENSARSLGIFRPEWLADYYRLRRVSVTSVIEEWQKQEKVTPVQTEKLGEMWVHHSLLPLLPHAEQDKLKATHSAVLSPFDPVVWDRKRAQALFDFSYRLECYTPAQKRKYGYFVLPLLHQGALVGRMDAKMHRKQGELEIISLYLEEGIKPRASLISGLHDALTKFALWQGAVRIVLGNIPAALASSWGTGWEIAPTS